MWDNPCELWPVTDAATMLGIVLMAVYGYVLGAVTVGLIWWFS